MNTGDYNYYDMVQSNRKVITIYDTIVSADGNISPIITLIDAKLIQIDSTIGRQIIDSTGATKTEHALWTIGVDNGKPVSAGLKAYFRSINDMTSYETINFSVSKLLYVKKDLAVERMQLLYDTANAVTPLTVLAPFGITSASLNTFKGSITDLKNALPVKKQMKAQTKTATKQLKIYFGDLRKLYISLDDYVEIYQFTQPDFYMDYKNSRKIYNLGKTTTSIEVTLDKGQFVCVFKDKFIKGDFFTIRNQSEETDIDVFMTNDETVLPTKYGATVKTKTALKAEAGVDFGGVVGRYVCLYNPSPAHKAKVTVILAHGKSSSKAPQISNITPFPPPSPA